MYANIKFIYGMSGCSKTTTAIQVASNFKTICCAYTHSAVNNLKEKAKDMKNVRFMTIHKMLGIGIDTIIKRKLIKSFVDIELIIIDEFTLIPLDILDYLFELTELYQDIKFVFVGDFIQLPSIEQSKQPINLSLLTDEKFKSLSLPFRQTIRIADHLSNSCYVDQHFKQADKLVLMHNYRNGTHVNEILNDALDYKFEVLRVNSIKDRRTINKLIGDGYIVISSMYEHLSLINNLYLNITKNKNDENADLGTKGQNENNENSRSNTNLIKTKIGLSSINQDFILNENMSNDYVNGDVVKVVEILNEGQCMIKKGELEPIMINMNVLLPFNFITVHKSQGRTYDKVLIILDDLFEITMLYTAITRARDDVRFIKIKHLPNKEDIEAFKVMRDCIYATS